jgi:hypothetical protein
MAAGKYFKLKIVAGCGEASVPRVSPANSDPLALVARRAEILPIE